MGMATRPLAVSEWMTKDMSCYW